MKVTLTREPWNDAYEVRIGFHAGRVVSYASGVDERGAIIWAQAEEGVNVPVFLSLREDVVEAFARALGDVTQASDATVEALKDTKQVRDRLLALVESAWEQPA